MQPIFYHNLEFNINNDIGFVSIPIQCPNDSKHCDPGNIIKNGHDVSVKSCPQYFMCKDCGIVFYAHTSAFYNEIDCLLNDFLLKLFENGKFNFESVKQILDCSRSSVSHLFKTLIEAVNDSILTNIAWNLPVQGNIIFIDETFIKIMKKTWYLVVVVDEERHVLAWELVKKRTSDVLALIINRAISLLPDKPNLIVSDGFSAYKGAVKKLGYDLVHIRHVHKPPYGRMVVDIIKHYPKKVSVTQIATTNDIFCDTNTFIARVLTVETVKPQKGKRGRKKGSKNKNKKKKVGNKKNEGKKKKKRGPKNPFKEGVVHVYHYNKKSGNVKQKYGSDANIARDFEAIGKFFVGKHITSNIIEQQFSSMKCLLNFRGKRSVDFWNKIINLYFTIREYPGAVEEAINGLKLCPQIIHRSPDLILRLLKSENRIKSKVIKVEVEKN